MNPFFRLHKAGEVLNKYVMGVWSDSLAATFVVSFVVAVFVPDVERIRHNVRVVVGRYKIFARISRE